MRSIPTRCKYTQHHKIHKRAANIETMQKEKDTNPETVYTTEVLQASSGRATWNSLILDPYVNLLLF